MQTQGNFTGNGVARPHGEAKIQPHHPPQPIQELAPQRAVQTEPGTFLGDQLSIEELPLGKAHLDNIAGHNAHQHKDQHRHPEQGREYQQKPPEHIATHGGYSANQTVSSC